MASIRISTKPATASTTRHRPTITAGAEEPTTSNSSSVFSSLICSGSVFARFVRIAGSGSGMSPMRMGNNWLPARLLCPIQ